MKSLYERCISSSSYKDMDRHYQALRSAILVRADNVSQYFFESSSKDQWDRSKDFPNIAPPFDNFFVEFAAPNWWGSQSRGHRSQGLIVKDYNVKTEA